MGGVANIVRTGLLFLIKIVTVSIVIRGSKRPTQNTDECLDIRTKMPLMSTHAWRILYRAVSGRLPRVRSNVEIGFQRETRGTEYAYKFQTTDSATMYMNELGMLNNTVA